MADIFIRPFLRAGKVMMGQTKELARRVMTGVKMIFPMIVATFIPILRENYDKIFEEEKEDLERIRSEYSDVYAEVDKVMSGDAQLLMFFANPGAVAVKYLADTAPSATASLLSAVTGGVFDKALNKVKGRRRGRTSPRDIFDSYAISFQNMLNEEKEDGEPTLRDIVGSRKFVKAVLKASPKANIMQKDARAVYRKTISIAEEQAMSVLQAKTIAELEKIIKTQFPDNKEYEEFLKQMNDNEKKLTEAQLLESVKGSIKKFYTKPLEDRVAMAKEFGLSDDDLWVKDHMAAIAKINSIGVKEQA
jgi:hypothetical protein